MMENRNRMKRKESMKIIICNDATAERYRKKLRKRKWIFIVCIIGSLSILAVSVLGHWTDIKGLWEKESPVHIHVWRTASLQNSSCVEDGALLRVCEECHAEENVVLPAYGHTMEMNTCLTCGQRASDSLRFQFKIDEEGEPYAVITGIGSCTDRHLIIPNVLGGIAVTEIADGAFRGNTQIYSVTLHAGLTKIGESAFEDCTNVSGIFLPQGLPENIAFGSFDNTAYANKKENWTGAELYCNGYILARTDGNEE